MINFFIVLFFLCALLLLASFFTAKTTPFFQEKKKWKSILFWAGMMFIAFIGVAAMVPDQSIKEEGQAVEASDPAQKKEQAKRNEPAETKPETWAYLTNWGETDVVLAKKLKIPLPEDFTTYEAGSLEKILERSCDPDGKSETHFLFANGIWNTTWILYADLADQGTVDKIGLCEKEFLAQKGFVKTAEKNITKENNEKYKQSIFANTEMEIEATVDESMQNIWHDLAITLKPTGKKAEEISAKVKNNPHTNMPIYASTLKGKDKEIAETFEKSLREKYPTFMDQVFKVELVKQPEAKKVDANLWILPQDWPFTEMMIVITQDVNALLVQAMMRAGIDPVKEKTDVYVTARREEKGVTGKTVYRWWGFAWYNPATDNVDWVPATN